MPVTPSTGRRRRRPATATRPGCGAGHHGGPRGHRLRRTSDATASEAQTFASIKNKDGNFVAPTVDGATAALANAEVKDNLTYLALNVAGGRGLPDHGQHVHPRLRQADRRDQGGRAEGLDQRRADRGPAPAPNRTFVPLLKSLQEKAIAQLSKITTSRPSPTTVPRTGRRPIVGRLHRDRSGTRDVTPPPTLELSDTPAQGSDACSHAAPDGGTRRGWRLLLLGVALVAAWPCWPSWRSSPGRPPRRRGPPSPKRASRSSRPTSGTRRPASSGPSPSSTARCSRRSSPRRSPYR